MNNEDQQITGITRLDSSTRSISITDYIHELNSAPKPKRAPISNDEVSETNNRKHLWSQPQYSRNRNRANLCGDIQQQSTILYPTFNSDTK